MHREPRGTNEIRQIVLHVNVGPETNNGAASLAKYLDQIDGGYHKIVDDAHLVKVAGDDVIVWGATGANVHGLHLCFIGGADQTAEQWADAYSRGELEIGARAVADWCRAHNIPPVLLSPADVAAGKKGITTHRNVETSGLPNTGGASGHYDPGPHFPLVAFIKRVGELLQPPVPIPTSEGLLTTVALNQPGNPKGRTPTARPIPALGIVLLENGARLHGDAQVSGSKNFAWRDPAVPKGAKLIDIARRETGPGIVALYEIAPNETATYEGVPR